MTTHAEHRPPTTVLNRISTLLDAFDGRGPLTLNEVAEYTGFPRSSAHRMLVSLVKLRWVRRDGHRYELGVRLVELGSLAVHQAGLHRVALPSLHELHRLTGHVVHLAVLDGPDIVCLEKIGGRVAAAIPTRVGGRLPAHCTALGKALLSSAHPSELDRVGGPGLTGSTENSIPSRGRLHREIAESRRCGVAYDRQEMVIGYGCIAAPIRVPGAGASAISVCGPISQIFADPRLADHVRVTALAIARALTDASRRHSA